MLKIMGLSDRDIHTHHALDTKVFLQRCGNRRLKKTEMERMYLRASPLLSGGEISIFRKLLQ